MRRSKDHMLLLIQLVILVRAFNAKIGREFSGRGLATGLHKVNFLDWHGRAGDSHLPRLLSTQRILSVRSQQVSRYLVCASTCRVPSPAEAPDKV